ncbi:MAG: tRNA (adenosine(37)-N6)-threonylcarbamoyltransferase complex ATPase subunit type 1 TsaE [Planctomycetota bacterium]|nr:tRNA (adenosine(37)-N6)-threonylcarbamoyltransferase complex ATPase subunit type 1 TsaE [Planctomycetota bacterium]
MITLTRELPELGATEALAEGFARLLRAGDVVALAGPLGAGKTAFVRGVAGALGVAPGLVSSPTFVVVNVYPVAGEGAVRALVHVDAYRLGGADELDTLGWDRLFDGATRRATGGGAALIEWPQRLEGALPADAVRMTLEPTGADSRRVTLEVPDEWASREGFDRLRDYPPTRCRVTGRWVSPLAASWPFVDERARLADLYGWFEGAYRTSRGVRADDEAGGESGDEPG